MKTYLFYEANGAGRMVTTLDDETDPSVLNTGFNWVEIQVPVEPGDVRVANGVVIEYSNEGKERKKALPPYPAVWNPSTEQWDDIRDLDQLRADKWKVIKAARDAVEFGPFEYNGMVFDGDLNAQRRLNSYISLSKTAIAQGQSFSAQFILANDTVVTLQANDFVQIEVVKVMQVADAFTKAALLRVQIDTAQTKEAIEAIAW